MRISPVTSFLRFFFGFTLFISISFGITYAVNTYTTTHAQSQQAAVARARMLEMHYPTNNP
jgi:hypothetical protein